MRSRHLCAPSTVRRERSDVEMHAGEKKRSATNVVMQPTRLESLPNELLLDLCAYLSTGDLVRAFYNANIRFNRLLDVHFQSFGFDCQSTTWHDFDVICRQYLPHLGGRLTALRLSDNDETPQQIESFFASGLTLGQFVRLRSLSLCDLCSTEILNRILLLE